LEQIPRWVSVWGIPALVVLLFLGCIGTISLTRHPIGDYGVETDFYWDYAPAADALLRGELPIERYSFRGPGYPMVLAIGRVFTGDTFLAGKLISLIAAAASLWMIYRLFTPVLGSLWATAGIILIAMNGVFIEFAIRVGTDMFFLSLNLLFVMMIGMCRTRSVAFLAGVVAGFAFLTRYNGVALILVLALWAVCAFWSGDQDRKKLVLMIGVGVLMVVLPWLLSLYLITGNPFHNLNSANILYTISAAGKIPWDQFWYTDAKTLTGMIPASLSEKATLIAQYVFKNFSGHFERIGDSITGWLVLSFAIVGGVMTAFQALRLREWHWWLILSIFNYLILSTLFFSERFFLPIIPILVGLVLALLHSIGKGSLGRRFGLASVSAGVALSVILLVGSPKKLEAVVHRLDNDPVELLEMIQEPALRGIHGDLIAARKPHFAYLTGNGFIPLPLLGSVDELIQWMKQERVSYVFLDHRGANTRPALWSLLGSPHSRPEFELIAYMPQPAMGFWKLR